jgi:hypothetical protein
MKRTPPYRFPNYGIDKIKTFFKWIQCDKCRMEFRREYIWKCFIKSILFTDNIYGYICMTCAPTIEDAVKFRDKMRLRYKRQPKPPEGGTGESK